MRAGFRKFSKKKFMHRARAARPRVFDSLPSQDPNRGRCHRWFSVMRSKIKIRTSSPYKAQLALYGDEVRILIFDDPAELYRRKRPVMVRSGRGPFRPAKPRRAPAMHDFFFENLRNPAHSRRAGLMRQFCPGQLDSTSYMCRGSLLRQ